MYAATTFVGLLPAEREINNLQRKRQSLALTFTAAIMAVCLLVCRPARAQDPALRAIGGLFSIGGYWFTSGSADRAVGSPKFYTNASYFTQPAHFGALELSGGVQAIGMSDHFLPFSGGNYVDWYGIAFRLTTHRQMNHIRGVFTGGLYLVDINSERYDYNVARVAPSLYIGAEYPFARYFTLSAGYRVSEDVHGVNLDGFSLALRFF
jgi:hypothetical protein